MCPREGLTHKMGNQGHFAEWIGHKTPCALIWMHMSVAFIHAFSTCLSSRVTFKFACLHNVKQKEGYLVLFISPKKAAQVIPIKITCVVLIDHINNTTYPVFVNGLTKTHLVNMHLSSNDNIYYNYNYPSSSTSLLVA